MTAVTYQTDPAQTIVMSPDEYRELQDEWLRERGYGAFVSHPLLRSMLLKWIEQDWNGMISDPPTSDDEARRRLGIFG